MFFMIMSVAEKIELPGNLQVIFSDQDDCALNAPACRNGGQCIDLLHRFYCQCQPGYTDVNCDRGTLYSIKCTQRINNSVLLSLCIKYPLQSGFNLIFLSTEVSTLNIRFN